MLKRLGLNYLWGLGNSAAGVTLGGIYVAILMLCPKLINLARVFF